MNAVTGGAGQALAVVNAAGPVCLFVTVVALQACSIDVRRRSGLDGDDRTWSFSRGFGTPMGGNVAMTFRAALRERRVRGPIEPLDRRFMTSAALRRVDRLRGEESAAQKEQGQELKGLRGAPHAADRILPPDVERVRPKNEKSIFHFSV